MYIFSLDVLHAHLNIDITYMNSAGGGNNPVSGNSFGSSPSGSPNPGGGPGWEPFQYQANVREDGERYPDNASPSLVLETYNPTGDIPVQNDKQLGVLLDYRFAHEVRPMGYNNWKISKAFPSNSIIDRMARERLLAHIYTYRSRLPTAYRQLDLRSGTPKWGSVDVSSYIIASLNNSNS